MHTNIPQSRPDIRTDSGRYRPVVFNLFRSRANLILSHILAGRGHCRLQNHHGYIKHHNRDIIINIIRVFCSRAGPSLQAQEPRQQFFRRQVFRRTLRNQGCTFTRDDSCGSFQLLSAPYSLFGIGTDLKRSLMIPGASTWR